MTIPDFGKSKKRVMSSGAALLCCTHALWGHGRLQAAGPLSRLSCMHGPQREGSAVVWLADLFKAIIPDFLIVFACIMSTQSKYRLDYKPVPVHVLSLDLDFVVGEGGTTTVTNTMVWKPRDGAAGITAEGIYLNGRKDLTLLNFSINGSDVASGSYTLTEDGITVAPSAFPPTQQWDVRIVVRICPQNNTLLEGLYASNGMLCTQCEAEGFRGITFFFDRHATHTSRVTRHMSHVTRHTSHVTRHTSHVTRYTSHVTRHTSHVTRHT